MHDVEGGDAVRGWWQALRTRCGCVCPCHPFGASWEPRTGVGAGGGVGERAGERHKMPPDYFVRGSLETCKQSARLAPQIQTALRHKSEIEHHRNKIRLRAKRRGHYEFPVLDELSSGDTRERHRVYRRAQMQIDKILDPTASVPSVFIEPRKRWACCRGGGTLWKTPGGREGATPPGHHLWGRPLPPQLPQESPFLGFLSPGIQLSEMGAPSFSDAELFSSCPHPQCRHPLLCLVDAHFFSRCCPQPLSPLSLRPLPLKGEAFSVRSALICVLLGSPLCWLGLPAGGPRAPVPGGASSLYPAASHRGACRPTRR